MNKMLSNQEAGEEMKRNVRENIKEECEKQFYKISINLLV